jgi:hypothetical protein
MKCPNCGNEISEGHLICEKCGYEIRVVPDFDPAVDEPIRSVVTTDSPDGDNDKDSENEHSSGSGLHGIHRLKKIAVYGYFCIAGAALFISFLIYQIHIQSLDYQLDHAAQLIESEKYEEAGRYLESSYQAHPESSDILFLEADNYYKMKNDEKCIDALKQIAVGEDYQIEDREKAYDELIAILDKKNDYVEINELLHECDVDGVTTKYQNYMAITPQFSHKGGDYDGSVTLKLSANTGGDIFYTTDGTKPSKGSIKYLSPIKLDSGSYVISAIFINKYGISSDIATEKYNISVQIPDAPELTPTSGNFTKPCIIQASAPEGCSIFYTVDNSAPDEDSIPYKEPIQMPLGITNFKFIAINDESGNASEVTMRSYSLQISALIDIGQASAVLKDRMLVTGYLTDEQGHKSDMSGVMTYKPGTVISASDGQDYYTFNEYETDGAGGSMKTGNVFLVNIQNGSTAVLKNDTDNKIIASAF